MKPLKIEMSLPPVECSPNRSFHWGAKAKAVRLYREECYLFALKAGRKRPFQSRVTIDMDFYLNRGELAARAIFNHLYYPKDEQNASASAKAAIDALKDARIIKEDTQKYVTLGRVKLHSTKKDHQGRRCLVLTVTPPH